MTPSRSRTSATRSPEAFTVSPGCTPLSNEPLDELARATRSLRFLTSCNEALARATSPEGLLEEICRRAVDVGGFGLAVAGYPAGGDSFAIRPIAHQPPDEAMLGRLRRAWEDPSDRGGLARTALRTLQPVASNDLLVDPRLSHMRDDLALRCHAAAVALPLARGDERLGVLLLMSSEQGQFDDATVVLLQRLADAIAHGVAALRTHALLADVVDHAPVPFYVMTGGGRFVVVNRAWEEVTGRSRNEAIGKRLDEVFPSEFVRPLEEMNERAIATGRAVRADESVLIGGEVRLFDTVKFPVRDAEGRFDVVAGFSMEITDRKRAEERIRFQARLLEQVSDAVIAIDGEERITYANRAALERYAPGAAIDHVLGLNLRALYDYRWPDPAEGPRAVRALAETGTWRGEVVHVRRDGKVLLGEATVIALHDDEGRPVGSFAVIRDVSERKRADDALRESREQLRALAARLQSVREEEKTRIARDLHDELGQLLTALKLDVRWIECRVGELAPDLAGAIVDRAVATSELLDRIAASVQRIAAELRPGVLDQLGLGPALEDEARRFARRAGIACEVLLPKTPPELRPEEVTALYRIAQEALTNIARHARATRAQVSLAVTADGVILTVEDDGVGVPAAGSARGLGVLGMRERASALGGEVTVHPGEDQGTTVTARIPVLGAIARGSR